MRVKPSFCHVRTQSKMWCFNKKWGLTRHGIFILDFPPPDSEKEISVVYKPPRIWYSVAVACTKVGDV